MRLQSIRNGRSVTPAIGATARLFGSRRPPMRTTRIDFFSEGFELYPFASTRRASRRAAKPCPEIGCAARCFVLVQAEQHRARERALGDRQRVEQHHADAPRAAEPRPTV